MIKGKINTWYVIGQPDKEDSFGSSQLTPKGNYFNTLKEAKRELKLLETWRHRYDLFILKRTCQRISIK